MSGVTLSTLMVSTNYDPSSSISVIGTAQLEQKSHHCLIGGNWKLQSGSGVEDAFALSIPLAKKELPEATKESAEENGAGLTKVAVKI